MRLSANYHIAGSDATAGTTGAIERAATRRRGQDFGAYQGELIVQIGFDEATETDDIGTASFEHLSVVLRDSDET
ncbi:hypothetical protein [Ruegeria sp. ANG-R]|uniref:hypothetical protein n=1 Tax=Ruegeria sp. ANG-R TaxID=1577903 RepID=UPI001F4CAEBD|nr:hypothetical protein [Ruegeria sp. ANG-R]